LCSLFLNVRKMRRPMPPMMQGVLGPPVTWCRRAVWFVDRWLLEPIVIRPIDWTMDRAARLYGRVLARALRHKGIVVACGGLLAASAYLFAFGVKLPLPNREVVVKPVGRELVPSEDQNRFVVSVICPVGSNLAYVDDMLKKGEEALTELKDPVT